MYTKNSRKNKINEGSKYRVSDRSKWQKKTKGTNMVNQYLNGFEYLYINIFNLFIFS